ncbi:hypothetical protein C8T65DRAFT_671611 [Cerioporus squamosus]|nr:hypothetical protein C8T65DRAFT_671611 [Cerioporus squamosus]
MSFMDVKISLDSLDRAVDESMRLEVMRLSNLTDIEGRLRTTLARLRQYRNSFTSPVNRLPWEILGRIFEHVSAVPCLKYGAVYYQYGAVRRATRAAVCVTWVCSAWRTIALGWPRLWSKIHESAEFPVDSERSRLFLSRSGEAPLDFYLELPLKDHERTIFQDMVRPQ